MQLPKSIRENLRFLVVEVDSQLERLQAYLLKPDELLAQRIYDRAGYIYNLKRRIHESCLDRLGDASDTKTLMLRGIEFVATDLERIAELGRDCIKLMGYLDKPEKLEGAAYHSMLARVRRGVEQIEPALQSNSSDLALKIGQLEEKLDRDYNKLRKQHIADLKADGDVEDLTCSLFVAQRLEQMGDALLDISESIISANLGQPLNIDRYYSLKSSVAKINRTAADVQIEKVAETRSGSSIAAISFNDTHAKSEEQIAIFKDGGKRKVKEERQGVESWHEIYPGLAPKILSYKKRGESAALLIEHLPGLTFEQILLHKSRSLLAEALGQLSVTLLSVWRETRQDKPVPARFIQQLKKRLPEVYSIHPEFRTSAFQIGKFNGNGFNELLAEADQYEQDLFAPFSVYIHGDFNVDNIIYDPLEHRINFIDLHRSKYMDYVQDISVFMVSNYRLQVLDVPTRRKIMQVAMDMYRMAKQHAESVDDHTFDIRLALGLARSFATSTRFILDKTLSKSMFFRARYLIERVLACPSHQSQAFQIPLEEIFLV